MLAKLRPHQQRALDALAQSYHAGKRRPVVAMPTGAGKTLLAASMMDGALSKHRRAIFTVPALSLIDQTVSAFEAEGVDRIGVIQRQHPLTDLNQPIQVASVQTLLRRVIPPSDFVIIDECHRWFDFYERWMAMPEWQGVPFVGLSATPWTRGLAKHFDDLIIGATTNELIDAGYLVPLKAYAPSHPDLTGVRTVAGDYHEGDLSTAMDRKTIVADVVETWRRLGEDRPTLVFGVDRAHARHLQETFNETGIAADYVDAFTEIDEREAVRQRLAAGEVKVVCNVGVLTTGVDWPFVSCIVLARPTKSEILYVQIVGRGLRTSPGKENLLLLDHSDTSLRLGLPNDIVHDTLDDGRRQRSLSVTPMPKPKECPSCSFLKPAGVHACPACGFAPKRRDSVRVQAGSLVEINGRRPKQRALARVENLYGMLAWIGKGRNYKDGWAARQYREIVGRWPSGSPRYERPTAEVVNWVKSQQIRYAKRRTRNSPS